MLVGIDIIDINRIRKAAERTPRFLQRVFTRGELEYCFGKKNPYPSLAARFAAKEAVRKLHPVFVDGIPLQNIEVTIMEDGKPELLLHGKARAGRDQVQISQISLSLSHTSTQAVAVVVAMKG